MSMPTPPRAPIVSTTGMPHVMVRRNMQKIRTVMADMEVVVNGLTRNLDTAVLDDGYAADMSYFPRGDSLGVILRELLAGLRASRDLDNIAIMATREEIDRRYVSVDELSQDIRCYLESRPVRARADSLSAGHPGGQGIGAARTSQRNVGVYWWAHSPSTNARAAATGQRKGPAA